MCYTVQVHLLLSWSMAIIPMALADWGRPELSIRSSQTSGLGRPLFLLKVNSPCCSYPSWCSAAATTHSASMGAAYILPFKIAVSLPFSLISLDSAHPSWIIKCTFLHPSCKQALCLSPSLALQQLGRDGLRTVSVATLGRAEAKIGYGSYLGEQKKVGWKQEPVQSQVAPAPPRGSTWLHSHLMAMSTHFPSLCR